MGWCTMLAKERYVLFKDLLLNAKQWMESQEINLLGYEDVCIFRISNKIGEVKDSIVEAIEQDPIRKATEKDYCVDFLKITKKGSGTRVDVYNYTMDYTPAGLIGKDGKPMFTGTKCRYMPEGVVLPAGHEDNNLGIDIQFSRATTGKMVCDQVDSSSLLRVRSAVWVPEMKYVGDSRSRLPVSKNIVDIGFNELVKCMSLLAMGGEKIYKISDQSKFNGIIVTPAKLVYNQIVDAYNIAKG